MSTLFKSPPSTFVKCEDLKLREPGTFTAGTELGRQKLQNCKVSTSREASPVHLRNDHIVLLAIDGLLALHAAFKKRRQRRRTLRALADLDDRQLHDIGLTRDHKHWHAL
jgi:Domain of unknown function (DUF1127)